MGLAARRTRKLAITGVVVGLTLALGTTASFAGGPAPQLSYPAVVEQGQSFTLGGTGCVGDVRGGLDEDNWADVDFPSLGDWQTQINVPVDAEPGTYTWDIQCVREGSFFYAFSEIEVVPQGTLPTTPTVPVTEPTPDTAPATSAAPPAAGTAPAVAAQPRFTG